MESLLWNNLPIPTIHTYAEARTANQQDFSLAAPKALRKPPHFFFKVVSNNQFPSFHSFKVRSFVADHHSSNSNAL